MEEKMISLVENMINGDEPAFDELYHSYSGKLYRMAYFITGNKSDSEDILQETFVTCFLHRAQIKRPEQFQSWLYRILVRAAVRSEKKRKGKRELSYDAILEDEDAGGTAEQIQRDGSEGPLAQILRRESEGELWNAVNALDAKHRTVVLLYYYNELSTREIARITGTLEGTVKSRLHKARALLRERFLQDAGSDSAERGKLCHE